MYIQAELVTHSYHPLYIEKGMYFSRHVWPGSDREYREIWQLDKDINDEEDVFMAINGASVKISIISVEYPYNVIADFEDIGWFDVGDESDELHDVTLHELNKILDTYQGMLEIDVDEEYVPLYQQDKVVIRYLQDNEETN